MYMTACAIDMCRVIFITILYYTIESMYHSYIPQLKFKIIPVDSVVAVTELLS